MHRHFLLIVLLALAACGNKISLMPPANAPLVIVSGELRQQVQPSDAKYRNLRNWLEQNQSGWSQLYATNPNGGIIVSFGDLRLQFVGSSAFVKTRGGMFTKPVKESEYAFLNIAAGT